MPPAEEQPINYYIDDGEAGTRHFVEVEHNS